MEQWFRRRSDWRNNLVDTYGSPEENPDFWNGLSANAYLAEISGPVQLHHGTSDDTVPYSYSTTLDSEIRAAGKKVELILYRGDNHNISVNLNNALTVSVVFFDQYVKGYGF